MQKGWLEKIEAGVMPSELLLDALADDPTLSGGELAQIFLNEFPGIHRHARPFISRWIRPGSTTPHGLKTEDMDQRLTELVEEWKILRSQAEL